MVIHVRTVFACDGHRG